MASSPPFRSPVAAHPPPSRQAAEPPDSRAALQLSRPTAEPPSSQPAEPPSHTAAEALPPVGLPGTAPLAWAHGLSLFDLTSGASPAPPADADAIVRSQWATRDAAARLAVPRHLPATELTRLPDSLRVDRDHFLSVCPTTLTVDLLEKALLVAEKSIVTVGASCGDLRTPFFEGCSPSPLLPSIASAAAADLVGLESVGAASAPSGRRRPGKGKGGKGAGGAGGGGGGGGGGSGGSGGGGGSGAGGGGGGGSSGGGGGGGGGGGSGGGGGGRGGVGGGGGGGDGGGGGGGGAGRDSAQRSGSAGGPRQQQRSVVTCPLSSFVSGTLQVSAVGVLVPALTSSILATELVSSVEARTPPSAASVA
ncbi:unnamed protein product [Closterium sp. NIES-65]|nr:unnamed protein product [Closterium sp. NIES-65]